MKHCSECGRPALVIPQTQHRTRRNYKRPRFMPDHDLCQKCWKSLRDRQRAQAISVPEDDSRFDGEWRNDHPDDDFDDD